MQQEMKLYDIYDYYYQPLWPGIWYIIGATLFFLALAALFYWFYKRRTRPSWVQAYERLGKLKPQDGRQAAFYENLITIVRDFFSSHYGCTVQSFTEHELIEFTRDRLSTQWAKELADLLDRAQKSKFARSHISFIEMQNDQSYMSALVIHLGKLYLNSKNK